MSSLDLPPNSANPPNRPRTSTITLTAPNSMDPANQTYPVHDEHRRRRDNSMEAKPVVTHNITQASKTLRDRRLEKRALEESKKKQEQMEEDIEESTMHELLITSSAKTISERWREQQRLLEAKHHQVQKQSSAPTASLRNVSTLSTTSTYSTTLPTIYDSFQATTPSPKRENYKPPSLVMGWIEQELAELNLGTYSPAPAAASQTDEHENENEIDEEGLPIGPLARRQALNRMKHKLQRRREQEEDREEQNEDEDEGEEETEQDLTFAAFDRKLRMKVAAWEEMRRKEQAAEPDNNELRFGPPKVGMQAVMEERARRKREKAAMQEADMKKVETSKAALPIKDLDPIRGMQAVMEDRAKRKKAKQLAEQASASKPSRSTVSLAKAQRRTGS